MRNSAAKRLQHVRIAISDKFLACTDRLPQLLHAALQKLQVGKMLALLVVNHTKDHPSLRRLRHQAQYLEKSS